MWDVTAVLGDTHPYEIPFKPDGLAHLLAMHKAFWAMSPPPMLLKPK